MKGKKGLDGNCVNGDALSGFISNTLACTESYPHQVVSNDCEIIYDTNP